MEAEAPENHQYITREAAKLATEAITTLLGARAESLEKAMLVGDTHLEQHIAQQILQINDALRAAEKLEIERIEQVRNALDAFKHEREEALQGLRREMAIVQMSSEEAIKKQEVANEKRFESVNEWRAQSQDRERTMQENLSTLTRTFLPREVADKQIEALEERVNKLERVNAQTGGLAAGKHASKSELFASIGVVGTLIAIIVVVANYIAG